jgi:hypothetical protein
LVLTPAITTVFLARTACLTSSFSIVKIIDPYLADVENLFSLLVSYLGEPTIVIEFKVCNSSLRA